jgi:hypothetical protein
MMAAGSRLAAIITRDLPIHVINSRQTSLAPELSGPRREQAEVSGVKVRWPRHPAQSLSTSVDE